MIPWMLPTEKAHKSLTVLGFHSAGMVDMCVGHELHLSPTGWADSTQQSPRLSLRDCSLWDSGHCSVNFPGEPP